MNVKKKKAGVRRRRNVTQRAPPAWGINPCFSRRREGTCTGITLGGRPFIVEEIRSAGDDLVDPRDGRRVFRVLQELPADVLPAFHVQLGARLLVVQRAFKALLRVPLDEQGCLVIIMLILPEGDPKVAEEDLRGDTLLQRLGERRGVVSAPC